jgi:hypothetical protein
MFLFSYTCEMICQLVPSDCKMVNLPVLAMIAVPAVVEFNGTTFDEALVTVVVPEVVPDFMWSIKPGYDAAESRVMVVVPA